LFRLFVNITDCHCVSGASGLLLCPLRARRWPRF